MGSGTYIIQPFIIIVNHSFTRGLHMLNDETIIKWWNDDYNHRVVIQHVNGVCMKVVKLGMIPVSEFMRASFGAEPCHEITSSLWRCQYIVCVVLYTWCYVTCGSPAVLVLALQPIDGAVLLTELPATTTKVRCYNALAGGILYFTTTIHTWTRVVFAHGPSVGSVMVPRLLSCSDRPEVTGI